MAATTKAYILIECSIGTTKEVVTGLKKLKEIKSVETVTGPYDVIAVVELEALNELGDLVTQIVQMAKGIKRTVTCLVVQSPVMCELTSRFEHLGDNGLGVIEPDFRRHAADVVENCDKTFEQTFLIFSLRHMEIAFIAIRERQIYSKY